MVKIRTGQNVGFEEQYTELRPITGLDKQFFNLKLLICSYPSVLTYVLGAEKNRLIEMFFLSYHNICFG